MEEDIENINEIISQLAVSWVENGKFTASEERMMKICLILKDCVERLDAKDYAEDMENGW